MIEEKSRSEIFRDHNHMKKMDKMFRFLNPPKSFKDLKEKSQEIQNNLEEQQEKQKKKSQCTSESCGYK